MKKIMIFVFAICLVTSCNMNGDRTSDSPNDDLHNCLPIPDGVPHVFKNGTPIEWDCEMKSFYVNGDLKFYYDSLGGLIAIEKIR